MQVAKIDIDYNEARRQHRRYLKHRAIETDMDAEIRRAFHALSKGTVVIQALKSIALAGVDERHGLPKLAICRADRPAVWVDRFTNGSALFRDHAYDSGDKRILRERIPAGSFPSRGDTISGKAYMPMIPIHLRPKRALRNYHILWEAEWSPVPPGDPYLLQRIGKGDLWIVHAMWDLTDVEKAAMATRIGGAH